ncbi:hypothetical protein SAMN03159335_05411 [Burkholderia cepacia]|uniref:hypothetical protein n=1 Tax=Burkholderia cepacia TaxID=292 RepID=UPI0008B27709|nr:hypothetical protein [Burkholderia cepacia]SEU36277.1 hypothetical protein SAMN03159335_05411 [Burkholderia cepacia]
MPKLTQEFREVVVSTTVRVGQLNKAAVEFRDNVKQAVSVPGAAKLGVAWQDSPPDLPVPGFILTSFGGKLIAEFDHVFNGEDVMGRFRFYRHVGDVVEPKFAEFWAILFDANGNATWSSSGGLEWSTSNEGDLREFVYRLLAELYGKFDRV